jgi:CheY-like chemotaxis protein
MPLLVCATCRQKYRTETLQPGHAFVCPTCRGSLQVVRGEPEPDESTAQVAVVPPEVGEAAKDPARRLGRFVSVSELGRGSMGTVVKAWDTRLGRWVAIKLLRTGATDAEELDRFRREASVVASLDHPNIAPIYDVFEHGGRLSIVMKYIEGRTLDEMYLREGGRPPTVDRAVRMIRDVCLGVGYAHGRGFVHRDLKPGNLMLDKDARVYVLDFGLVKVLVREAITDLGRIMGTPNFMSPELAMGLARDVDARTDVFSLGATLWTLLAGQAPFRGTSGVAIVRAITREPTPSLRTRRPDVPDEIEAVIFKALEKDREARYPTGVEMATALNSCLVRLEATLEAVTRSMPVLSAGAPARVLVVEDEEAIAQMIKAALSRDGLEVHHIDDGSRAMELAGEIEPVAVILDLALPGMDGWEILRRLRQHPTLGSVPVLLVTGQGGDENVVRGFQMGADDYVTKPFSVAELRARVRRQIMRRHGGSSPPPTV